PSLMHDTPPIQLYTLSLHDALPISLAISRLKMTQPIPTTPGKRSSMVSISSAFCVSRKATPLADNLSAGLPSRRRGRMRCGKGRSEEHTSELQSLRHLVCRLLLEKK